jgi:hypothetical protein
VPGVAHARWSAAARLRRHRVVHACIVLPRSSDQTRDWGEQKGTDLHGRVVRDKVAEERARAVGQLCDETSS